MTIPFVRAVSVSTLVLWISSLVVADEEFEPGVDYKVLNFPNDVATKDASSKNSEKISVVEYFSYGCVACKKFEVEISTWLDTKEDDVAFRREAVVFFEDWAILAKAYYVAIELDVLDAVHIPMFEALHVKKLPITNREHIEQLFLDEANIDSEVFRKVYNDEDQSILNRILEVHETARFMSIKNTPTVVVNDKYLVNTRTAQSRARIFRVVNHLVEKVRGEKKSTTPNDNSQG